MRKIIVILSAIIFTAVACKKDPQINSPVVVTPPPAPAKIEDTIYPNPCKGTFTIGTNSTDSQTVVLVNTLGQVLMTLTINGTTAIVDNNLTDGVYMIKITNKTDTILKKLIVLR
ncbi:MAG: T9SS type A sorting domain-containing protein [Bacteroidia bacterium]